MFVLINPLINFDINSELFNYKQQSHSLSSSPGGISDQQSLLIQSIQLYIVSIHLSSRPYSFTLCTILLSSQSVQPAQLRANVLGCCSTDKLPQECLFGPTCFWDQSGSEWWIMGRERLVYEGQEAHGLLMRLVANKHSVPSAGSAASFQWDCISLGKTKAPSTHFKLNSPLGY